MAGVRWSAVGIGEFDAIGIGEFDAIGMVRGSAGDFCFSFVGN